VALSRNSAVTAGVSVKVGSDMLGHAIVPPNNPVDLQSLKLIDFHLFRWSAQQRLFCVVGALTSMLKTSAQLRLENLALRQQLAVLDSPATSRGLSMGQCASLSVA